MRTNNLAIVFVDIAGFTERTGQQSRSESERWLHRYERILLPLVRAFAGRRVKTIGDAYLCSFASPTDALLFGMAAQDRLAAYNQTVPESESIQVRVAVNTGEVRVVKGDIYGEPVNIAARVESLTPAGEIWFTEAVNLAMTRSEVPAEEVGMRELKGIREPVRLYRVPKGGDYRLAAGGVSCGDCVDRTSLPFGGLGLSRAEDRGVGSRTLVLHEGLRFWWEDFCATFSPIITHARSISSRGRIAIIGLAALAVLVGAFYMLAGSAGLSDEIEAVWKSQGIDAARIALENHPKGKTPAGISLAARFILHGSEPNLDEVFEMLRSAIEADPSLSSDDAVVADLVTCLDRRDARPVIDFIVGRVGDGARGELLHASRLDNFWLRWNSIRALQILGFASDIDWTGVFIRDLETADSCSSRRHAVEQLRKRGDRRALPALHRAAKRSVFENLCMGGAIGEAISEMEKH